MHRLASLDYLRGLAALAVALPHYVMFGSKDWPLAEAASILAVEIFFVLSGFVLAPQLLDCVASHRARDTWTFLVRRWMRTVPPYLVALLIVTLISGNVASTAFPQYVFYVQNLWRSLPENLDYFAVAWSLSIEEMFYVVAAALVLGANRLRLARGRFIWLVALLAALVAVSRLVFGDLANWDADVRRVTLFRLDAIAWGFLLYCTIGRIDRRKGPLLKWCSIALALAAAGLALWVALRVPHDGSSVARHLYPLVAGILGCTTIITLYLWRDAFHVHRPVAETGFFFGRVSYTIYLFHTPAILLLRPLLETLPLLVQFAIYTSILILFCAAFFASFEAPILAARPRYGGVLVRAASFAAVIWRRVATALAAFVGLAIATRWFFFNAWPGAFHAALLGFILAFILLLAALNMTRLASVRVLSLSLALLALTLPVADALFSRTQVGSVLTRAEPVYSFREAKGDPDAFRLWWARYVAEWGRGVLAYVQGPDPQGQLPFILKPGARGRFFEADVPVNALGFRGAGMDADKRGAYRIFVVGESPVFGTMFRAGETTFPEVLQKRAAERLVCARPIEVVNAGVPAAGLADNLVRLERFVAPLRPDMIISYHGYNGLGLVDPQIDLMPRAPVFHRRGSPLLGEASFRIAMQAYRQRVENYNARGGATQFSNRYEALYQAFIDWGRAHGARVILANLSAVVNERSPREVIDFYGRVFQPIDRLLPAIAEHNRMVETVAKRAGATFVDTRAGLDGEWDADLFVDIVHFTQKGSNLIADKFLDAIAGDLAGDPAMQCRPR